MAQKHVLAASARAGADALVALAAGEALRDRRGS